MDPAQEGGGAGTANYNACNNKLMTLQYAREELVRQGMSCHFMHDRLLVGVLSECRWELTVKVDVVVCVHQVIGALTLDRLTADLIELPSLVGRRLLEDTTSCPLRRANQVMVVYYAESISPEALNIIRRPPRKQWCAITFLAAQDALGQFYYLSDSKTPFWHQAFYPELVYRAGKLTGRPLMESRPPGLPTWIKLVNLLSIVFFVGVVVSPSTAWILLFTMGLLFIALIAQIAEWFQTRKLRKVMAGGDGLLQEIGDVEQQLLHVI